MTNADFDAPGTGHNLPANAQDIAVQLGIDFADLETTLQRLTDIARNLQPFTDGKVGAFTALIKEFDGALKETESHRVKAKHPYLQAERAVDAWFNDVKARLRDMRDVVYAPVDLWNRAKLKAERERMLVEQRERDRIAEEARKKAERARNEERKATLEREAAAAAAAAAQAKALDEQLIPADLVRQHHGSAGTQTTMKRVPHVEIIDYDEVPLEELRPYIPREALLRAVKAYAKQTEYKQQMAGCVIEMREATVVV